MRAAVAGDLAAISAIYAHHVETGIGSFELAAPDDEEMPAPMARRRRARLAVSGGRAAGRDAGIAGYAYASPYRARPGYRYTVEDSVYVDPGCTGQGVGRALLAALIAACAPLGYRQMVAVIGGSDNAASIGLHAALGFERRRVPDGGRPQIRSLGRHRTDAARARPGRRDGAELATASQGAASSARAAATPLRAAASSVAGNSAIGVVAGEIEARRDHAGRRARQPGSARVRRAPLGDHLEPRRRRQARQQAAQLSVDRAQQRRRDPDARRAARC